VVEGKVLVAPVVVKETPSGEKRVTCVFGRIDTVDADALVCPQDSRFAGKTLEAELLQARYGNKSFMEAGKLFREEMEGSRQLGEKGVSELAPAFAKGVDFTDNENKVRRIVHVNLDSPNGRDPVSVLEEGVNNSLREASLYQNVHSVAVPLAADISSQGFKERLLAVSRGIADHFELTPDSSLDEVKIVINATDTPENRAWIEGILSPKE